ncbi:MAG TPA: SDR family oxidoreductase [Aliidongia sp.]|nr:SDR family oxidoreductase [Aliidongia sp.]
MLTRQSGPKIVVIGGSGLIGTKFVNRLRKRGHDVVAASSSLSVDAITRQGLAATFSDARVVIDVADAPSLEDKAVLDFLETSSRNLLAAEIAAGVSHHVALSVVGAQRLRESGYFQAKTAQENLIRASGMPYTILRSTQFFEFVNGIVQSGADGEAIRLSPALVQPIAAADVVAVLIDIVLGAPANGTIELAGPELFPLDALARQILAANDDDRPVIADIHARLFGVELNDKSLTPGDHALLGPTRFEDWLCATATKA